MKARVLTRRENADSVRQVKVVPPTRASRTKVSTVLLACLWVYLWKRVSYRRGGETRAPVFLFFLVLFCVGTSVRFDEFRRLATGVNGVVVTPPSPPRPVSVVLALLAREWERGSGE